MQFNCLYQLRNDVGLLLLELFQFFKEFWILLKLCSWFPWLISTSASLRLRFVVHCQSSSDVTAKVLPWKPNWYKTPAILFWNHSHIRSMRLFFKIHWPTHSLCSDESPVPCYSSYYQSQLTWSATKMVSFFCQKSTFFGLFLRLSG